MNIVIPTDGEKQAYRAGAEGQNGRIRGWTRQGAFNHTPRQRTARTRRTFPLQGEDVRGSSAGPENKPFPPPGRRRTDDKRPAKRPRPLD